MNEYAAKFQREDLIARGEAKAGELIIVPCGLGCKLQFLGRRADKKKCDIEVSKKSIQRS